MKKNKGHFSNGLVLNGNTGTKSVSLQLFPLLLCPAFHVRSTFPSAVTTIKKNVSFGGFPLFFDFFIFAPFGCNFLFVKKQFQPLFFGGCYSHKNQKPDYWFCALRLLFFFGCFCRFTLTVASCSRSFVHSRPRGFCSNRHPATRSLLHSAPTSFRALTWGVNKVKLRLFSRCVAHSALAYKYIVV